MASARARAYNGGLGALPPAAGSGTEPLVRGSGGPEAESLFAFVRLSIFAVFIRVSADNCMALPEIQITW